ncbi:glycosyltransferase [Curtobacterium flaccumfaciens pv. flaccumfaciens]|uniref:Glycosyltransferase n=1 Tax=Curtobacterium flaccumfaciens pv. flaccumfaciens TaxID=138532 RepID=A0A9Q2ZNQ4_9MICO|nr:glycosyltransferase [Curtobacterium flaccumfaciens]MBT1541238.1 glycosyltransferase [Curtobacterium flaccumfaciens pv. flaccumfaciens]
MSRKNRNQPRVAIIGTRGYPSYYGGFETAVRRLVPNLADAGWDVTVYGRKGTQNDDPTRDPRVAVRQTRGIESKALSTLTYGLTASSDAIVRGSDVALVMNVANGFWLPFLRLRGIPTVVNVDGIEWERAKWGKLARAVFRAGAWLTAKFADTIVVDAEAIGDYWRKKFGRESVFIPYGGDLDAGFDVPLGLRRRQYVLVVARFVPENTIAEFLEAAEALADEHDVVIVGSSGYGGELDERARALADGNEKVQWLGHLSDDRLLHALWEHAGVYFHGHSVGGTNPALVQAMALGAPTVALDTVYNREVLGADHTAFVPAEPREISSAIVTVLGDPEQQEHMSALATERARHRYSWRSVAEGYEAALRQLVAKEK